MKRKFIGAFAFAVALSGVGASLAAAQDRTSNGNTTGSAVSRGDSGGGGAVSSGGGSGSSGSGGSSSSSGSSGMGPSSVSTPTTWSSFEAPRRADDGGQRTRGSGSSTGERAVSRSGGGSRSTSGSTPSAASSGSDRPRQGVPTYSRPRDGRPVTGTAVERVPPTGGGGSIIVYPPYYPYYPYYGWGFWGAGYGYGLGYLYYDPWYGAGYGGYGWGDPYGSYGGSGGGTGGYAVSRSYKESGNLRLKIDPKQAQIYVDGYYVGVVDSFDGAFQKLSLDSGNHKIELKADGFEPLQFEVLITPGETSIYKGEMKRIK